MEENKLGQEPAFPVEVNVTKPRTTMGISKRFYAACAAMQGLLANTDVDRFGHYKGDSFNVVTQAYKLADELLKQENL